MVAKVRHRPREYGKSLSKMSGTLKKSKVKHTRYMVMVMANRPMETFTYRLRRTRQEWFNVFTFLVVVDAYSKYLEIFPVKKSDSTKTIEKLRHLFSTFGLPEHIVSDDNGSQFMSEEFKIFLQYNEIQHTKTPPGHPATNGLAERYVGYFKEAMKKMSDKIHTREIRHILINLQSYANTHR